MGCGDVPHENNSVIDEIIDYRNLDISFIKMVCKKINVLFNKLHFLVQYTP